jgi:hypothetical protein
VSVRSEPRSRPERSREPELDAEEEVDVGRYWRALQARWWLPLAGLVIGATLGYIAAVGGGDVYRAETTVYLGQPFSPTGNAPVQALGTNPTIVSQIARSEASLKAAAAKCGTRVGRLGTKSFELEHEIRAGDRVVALRVGEHRDAGRLHHVQRGLNVGLTPRRLRVHPAFRGLDEVVRLARRAEDRLAVRRGDEDCCGREAEQHAAHPEHHPVHRRHADEHRRPARLDRVERIDPAEPGAHALAERRPSGLACRNHRAPLFLERLGQELGLRRLARAVEALEGDEHGGRIVRGPGEQSLRRWSSR